MLNNGLKVVEMLFFLSAMLFKGLYNIGKGFVEILKIAAQALISKAARKVGMSDTL
jgi:molybdenum-dependent DNA-binding transcriptional regulator ModE